MAPRIASLLVASLALPQTVQSTFLRPIYGKQSVEFVQQHLPGAKAMKVDSVNVANSTTDAYDDVAADVFNAEASFDIENRVEETSLANKTDIEDPIQDALNANKADMPSKVLDLVKNMRKSKGHDVSAIKQQLIGILDAALANFQNETSVDQVGLEALHQNIADCELSHTQGDAGTEARDSYQHLKVEHMQCRIDEGVLRQNFGTCDAGLAVIEATKDAKCNIPVLDEEVDTQSCHSKESHETKEEYLLRVRQHFIDTASEYTRAKAECDAATTALAAKSAECIGLHGGVEEKSMDCNTRQLQVSSVACMWATEVQAHCQEYEHCHTMAVASFREEADRLDAVVQMREKSRKGMEFMKCVVESIKAEGDGVDDEIFNNCNTKTFAEGTLSLTLPEHASEVTCAAPTIYPCSAEYLVDIQHGVPANVQLSDCSVATCHAISTTTTTTTEFTTTTTTATTTSLTHTVEISPQSCTSSRGDCAQAIDGDQVTYSWITRSGADGPQSVTFDLLGSWVGNKRVVGVDITTSGLLGMHGSDECLKVGFEIGGHTLVRVTGVTTDLPGAEHVPESDVLHAVYDLNQFRPKSTSTKIWWNEASGSQMKMTFNNCQIGARTHWPIIELRAIVLAENAA